MSLTGVLVGGQADMTIEAAYAFTDELARSGHSEAAILQIFQSPEYRGPYGAYLALGLDTVSALIHESVALFEACRGAARNRDCGMQAT